MLSNLTSNAGVVSPTALTTTAKGSPVAASTEIVTDATNEPALRGAPVI